jgi:hypothetical protein
MVAILDKLRTNKEEVVKAMFMDVEEQEAIREARKDQGEDAVSTGE